MDDTPVPVLMYHGIHDSPQDEGLFDPVYSITRRQFEAQLQWLEENGYRTVTCAELMEHEPGDRLAVITFDDGDRSNYTVSLPMLRERDMVADYFITTDWIGGEHHMSAGQLRALEAAGMSVQSHGKSHRYLSDLPAAELEEELVGSKRALESILGGPVKGLALPGGRGDERVSRQAGAAGYDYVCTSRLGLNPPGGLEPYALRRIAITRQMELDTFQRLVRGDRWEMGRRLARQWLLDGAKRLLGNRLYERLRGGVVR